MQYWDIHTYLFHEMSTNSKSTMMNAITSVPKCSTVTGLNDYQPIAGIPVVLKCYERMAVAHIKDSVDITVNPHE